MPEPTDKDIYSFFRDEIKREDEITHHRMTTCMAFQGFLFAAQTFLISGAWTVSTSATFATCTSAFSAVPGCNVVVVQYFRVMAIAAIGIVGYLAAIASLAGIIAARISIRDAKRKFATWRENDGKKFFDRVPQIHGEGRAFTLGNGYTVAVPMLIAFTWSIYLGVYVYFVFNRNLGVAFGTVAVLIVLLIGLAYAFPYLRNTEDREPSQATVASDAPA